MNHKSLRLVLLVVAMMLSQSILAKAVWKGFDFDVCSDAYEEYLPIKECVVVTSNYDVSFKFGEAIKGNLKSESVVGYDSHGYKTFDDSYTYENSYLPDGRISEIKVYDDDDDLYEVRKYKYVNDEKGPGYICEVYTGNGDAKSIVAFQNKKKMLIGGAAGTVTTYYNSKFRPTKMEMETMMIVVVEVYSYDSKGSLDGTTISGVGHVESTNYSRYSYNSQGVWLSRVLTGFTNKMEERRILTEEEYEEYERVREEERAAAEKKRLEEERLMKREQDLDYLADIKSGRKRVKEYNTKLEVDWNIPSILNSVHDYLQNGEGREIDGYAEYIIDGDDVEIVNCKASLSPIFNQIEFDKIQPSTIKLENIDSIAAIPAKYKLSLWQNRTPRYISDVELKMNIDKKTGEWELNNGDKINWPSNVDGESVLDFVLKQPFMSDGRKKVKVVVGIDNEIKVRVEDDKQRFEFNPVLYKIISVK